MSRFGDGDGDGYDFPNQGAFYQANLDRFDTGRRGLALYREMEAALLAMPVKALIHGTLIDANRFSCAVGQLVRFRNPGVEDQLLEVVGTMCICGHEHDPKATCEGKLWARDELCGCTKYMASGGYEWYESVWQARGIDPKIPEMGAMQLMYINDEYADEDDSPEERYVKVLAEVRKRIRAAEAHQAKGRQLALSL